MFAPLFDNPPTLHGRIVRLEPLAKSHEEGLWRAAGDPRIWRFMPRDATASREVFAALMAEARQRFADRLELPFATLDAATGQPIGSSRYLALRPEHRGLEIGWTWLAPGRWGSGANADAKLLMLAYAFEQLGCMRVEFKTDATNERSRAALAGLPARFEGVFRKHMLVRGGIVRDSAWYAITDDDWPTVRVGLEKRVERG
jgi:N-acetyltransferase